MTDGLPNPRPFSDGPSLGWGVIGPGWIAARFVTALLECTHQRLIAVASRSEARAKSFADKFDARSSYGAYDHLLMDPGVDAVYVATPHNEHARLALMATAAGKHVLVEKPFATSAEDARAVVESARGTGVLAMEAMWTRYLPGFDVLRQVLESGDVGEVAEVSADFGFMLPFDPQSRIYDPALGGGALLDAGVYPISLVSAIIGVPSTIFCTGTLAPSGVEDHAVVVTRHGSAIGIASTSTRAATPVHATISGPGGCVELGPPFIAAPRVVLKRGGGWPGGQKVLRWEQAPTRDVLLGLHYEAEAFASFVGDGRVESPVHGHDETVQIIATIDEARQQIGAGKGATESSAASGS
jgi:predicted dehydrogenase